MEPHAIDALLRALQSNAVPMDAITAAPARSAATCALLAALVEDDLLATGQTVPALLILSEATDSLGHRPFLPSVQAALHCATDLRIRAWSAMLLAGDADVSAYRAMSVPAALATLGKLDASAVARIEAAAAAVAAAQSPRPPAHTYAVEFPALRALRTRWQQQLAATALDGDDSSRSGDEPRVVCGGHTAFCGTPTAEYALLPADSASGTAAAAATAASATVRLSDDATDSVMAVDRRRWRVLEPADRVPAAAATGGASVRSPPPGLPHPAAAAVGISTARASPAAAAASTGVLLSDASCDAADAAAAAVRWPAIDVASVTLDYCSDSTAYASHAETRPARHYQPFGEAGSMAAGADSAIATAVQLPPMLAVDMSEMLMWPLAMPSAELDLAMQIIVECGATTAGTTAAGAASAAAAYPAAAAQALEDPTLFVSPFIPLPVALDTDRIARQVLVRELISRAWQAPISHMQQEMLLSAVGADPPCLLTADLLTARLPDIAEYNPSVAVELLAHLHALLPPEHMLPYLSALVHMETSLHSMEVVNKLTTSIPDLPPDFLHLYITTSIASCEGLTDKYHQNRLVRLLCVFLQSLIRSKAINVADLFVEMQTFCIQFSRIKEAAALFRVLKTVEASMVAPAGASDTA